MKLIKFLLSAGAGTRAECESFIKNSKITVNGNVINDFAIEINPEKDSIKLNDKRLKPISKVYFALNKPAGYITTTNDEKERPTIIDLIKKKRGNLFPVGRLDFNSEGLIFITNDGDFANKIVHPSNNIKKVYTVKIHGWNLAQTIPKLKKGIKINGQIIKPDAVNIIKLNPKTSWINITIHSGENRIIRKLCENYNLKISRLIRTQIGNFKLGNLQKGKYKIIDYKDISKIFE